MPSRARRRQGLAFRSAPFIVAARVLLTGDETVGHAGSRARAVAGPASRIGHDRPVSRRSDPRRAPPSWPGLSWRRPKLALSRSTHSPLVPSWSSQPICGPGDEVAGGASATRAVRGSCRTSRPLRCGHRLYRRATSGPHSDPSTPGTSLVGAYPRSTARGMSTGRPLPCPCWRYARAGCGPMGELIAHVTAGAGRR